MIIKTQKHLFERLEAVVKKMHPYEIPEIISFDIQQGYPGYLRWIDDSTEAPA